MKALKFIPIVGLFIIACSPKNVAPSVVFAPEPVAEEVLDPMQKDIPTDERVLMGKLDNGMHYYIQQNARPENRAELRLAVNAGSILEDEDQLGIAHFTEHMAFNGSENFEKNELVDYLEMAGARFGPDLNAYTSFDETVYMLQVRTDSTELFDKGLLILKDWASGITFDHEEIDKERGVVESEWRSRLSPDQRIQQKTFPVMYQGSRYADRLPIGDPEIIKSVDYDVVKRFYRDWYRPDLMAVIVVGNVEPKQVEMQIKEMFGSIPAVENPRKREKYGVPLHPETLYSIASDKEASFTRVSLKYKHPKVHTKDIGGYRENLTRSIYNTMLNSRLEELSKQPDPPYMFAFSGYSGDVGDIDAYQSMAFVPEGKAQAALEAVLTENERVLKHGFVQSEMDRAIKNMKEGAERAFKEMDKMESGNLAMRYVYNYLQKSPIPSPKQTLDLYEKLLPSVTLAEVNGLAKKWIRDESRVMVVSGPEKEESPLPTEIELQSIVSSIKDKVIEPYVDEVASEPFFTTELSPASITKEENFANVDLDYIELSNGVEVYFKKTEFKNDEILLSASSPGGTSLYGDDEYFNAQSAPGVINEAGIGNFSSMQLEKMMAGKTARVSPYIGTYSEGMNGMAAPKDFEILFQMIYQLFTNPREDAEAFESYITKQKGLYKNLMSNPNFFFSDFTSKLKFNNHPRMGFPEESDWDKLNYAKAMELYKDRFADASDFTFNFVGNFDEAQLKEYCKLYLGNLPSTNREENWKDIGIRVVPGSIEKTIQKGKAPKTQVEMYFKGDFEYNDLNSYHLNSTISYLRIKLREELREDKGGVYGVGVRGGGSKKPVERYGITISFNSDPDKTSELISAAKQVIEKAIKEGPNEQDMQKVKETQIQSRTKALEQNRFWQQRISSEHENEKNFDSILLDNYKKKVNSLTAAQIKNAAGKYFDYDGYIQIVMEPEAVPSN